MQVSSIVVCKPNTHPSEVPFMDAVAADDSITITTIAHRDDFLKQQSQWIKVISNNEDALEAEVLVTTMKKLCTKLTVKSSNGKATPVLKKTVISGFKKIGIFFADDYFTTGKKEGQLDLLPLPYKYDTKFAGADFRFSECFVIWRAYIAGSEERVEEEQKSVTGNDAMDRLTALMQGTKI